LVQITCSHFVRDKTDRWVRVHNNLRRRHPSDFCPPVRQKVKGRDYHNRTKSVLPDGPDCCLKHSVESNKILVWAELTCETIRDRTILAFGLQGLVSGWAKGLKAWSFGLGTLRHEHDTNDWSSPILGSSLALHIPVLRSHPLSFFCKSSRSSLLSVWRSESPT
jgi:hypothetical protein